MKKTTSFITVIILIMWAFFPIISNASNSIDNNYISENIQENTKEDTIENIIENNIQNNTVSNNENIITNEIENTIQSEIIDNNTITNNIHNNFENSTQNNIENIENIENNITKEKEEENFNNEIQSSNLDNIAIDNELGVKYSSHVQYIGWQEYVKNGELSGTTGKSLRMESLKIELFNNTSNINIKYSAYVQGIGWQKNVSNGQEAGTTGKSLRMEAIKIWLENTDKYSIMYRTHIQDYGWGKWYNDGEISGNLEESKKIEAIEIKIVSKIDTKMTVKYSSHIQDIGWQSEKSESDISGTIRKNLRLEAIKISLKNKPNNISLKYRVYVENSGWNEWKKEGEISGTTGKSQKVYGIRIQLEGTKDYSILYRTYIENIGWTTWKKNGEVSGNISDNKKIEAIQIKISEEKNNISNSLGVEYYTYLEDRADNENYVESNGDISGTTGQNRKMYGIQIELLNAPSNSHIKYKTHIQDIGWLDWVNDSEVSGLINSNLKIEAIKIELEGLPEYTVEYKAHIQDIGWTDWYIDGETAGTTGKNKRVEAIQIRIVPRYKRYFKGIDVSYWQGQINFDKLAASNEVDYMIARIGWYSNSRQKLMVDTQFERNYKEAKKRNIPLGAYVYSYAISIEEARKEAQSVVNYLKTTGQTDFKLPIFFDIEDNSQISLGKDTITQMCIAFCETLKNAGFNVGVYSYSYWLENYMYISSLPESYSIWVAQYNKNHDGSLPENIYKYANKYDMWQYSSKGKVDGINGDVDMNICYKKYF